MRAIERAARAVCDALGYERAGENADTNCMWRDPVTKETRSGKSWEAHLPEARTAVLAFLDGVDAREIGHAAAAIRDNRDCDKTEAVIAALRAEAKT